jgi:hypothetical protein
MIFREILGLAAMLAGLVAMIAGLIMSGGIAFLILGGMVVGTAGTVLVIHTTPADEADQDSFDEGVDAPS